MNDERVLRTVNDEIREFARRADPDGRDAWEFLCECSRPGCCEYVLVALPLFDQLRREGLLLVADGHPVARAREARRVAHGRVDDAAALRAQAEQQLRRAKRNASGRALAASTSTSPGGDGV